MKKEFKKSDLKTGMVAETKEGNKYLILDNGEGIYFAGINTWDHLDNYTENLLHKEFSDLDIVKVYKTRDFGEINFLFENLFLIWSREKIIITKEEIAKKFNIDIDLIEIK